MTIGFGPIVIGEACEFDYSSTQPCKALGVKSYEIILVNCNPAIVMTDPEIGDRGNMKPLTPRHSFLKACSLRYADLPQ